MPAVALILLLVGMGAACAAARATHRWPKSGGHTHPSYFRNPSEKP